VVRRELALHALGAQAEPLTADPGVLDEQVYRLEPVVSRGREPAADSELRRAYPKNNRSVDYLAAAT
jgi:hypothetical protein